MEPCETWYVRTNSGVPSSVGHLLQGRCCFHVNASSVEAKSESSAGSTCLGNLICCPVTGTTKHNNTQTLHVCHICLHWDGLGVNVGTYYIHGVYGTYSPIHHHLPIGGGKGQLRKTRLSDVGLLECLAPRVE